MLLLGSGALLSNSLSPFSRSYGSQVYYDLSHLHKLKDDMSRVSWPMFHIAALLIGYPFFLGLQKLRQVILTL